MRLIMREVSRRDGSVALLGENGDEDLVVVEPRVTAFIPVRGNAQCVCGTPLQPWAWQCVASDSVELRCDRCHRVHGHLRLGTKLNRVKEEASKCHGFRSQLPSSAAYSRRTLGSTCTKRRRS